MPVRLRQEIQTLSWGAGLTELSYDIQRAAHLAELPVFRSVLFFLTFRGMPLNPTGAPSRPSSAKMNGTRCAISPDTKATSRESRSSFKTSPPRYIRCRGQCSGKLGQ
jgi:hypothetical protein